MLHATLGGVLASHSLFCCAECWFSKCVERITAAGVCDEKISSICWQARSACLFLFYGIMGRLTTQTSELFLWLFYHIIENHVWAGQAENPFLLLTGATFWEGKKICVWVNSWLLDCCNLNVPNFCLHNIDNNIFIILPLSAVVLCFFINIFKPNQITQCRYLFGLNY